MALCHRALACPLLLVLSCSNRCHRTCSCSFAPGRHAGMQARGAMRMSRLFLTCGVRLDPVCNSMGLPRRPYKPRRFHRLLPRQRPACMFRRQCVGASRPEVSHEACGHINDCRNGGQGRRCGPVGKASSACGGIGEVRAMMWSIKVGCSTVTELASRCHQPLIGTSQVTSTTRRWLPFIDRAYAQRKPRWRSQWGWKSLPCAFTCTGCQRGAPEGLQPA